MKREQAVPFRVGERLTYDIGGSSYVTAGVATITVHEKRPSYGSTAYYVVAEGRPTPLLSKLYTLYYRADTLLDVLRPRYIRLPGDAAPARGFTIWFTNDARRLPVKMRAQLAVGAFTLTLSQATGL